MSVNRLTRIAVLAGIYAILTIILPFLSYGPLFQLRVSEALTVLPYVMPGSAYALFVGCLVANIVGGLGILDIVFGSLATLAAGLLTARMPNRWLAPLPPVIVNAVVVGSYLAVIAGFPARLTIGYVALGQLLACYGLGYPLLMALERNQGLSRLVLGRERGGV